MVADPELIKMLQEVLAALGISEIKPKLLSGIYDIYSLSYRSPHKKKIGIVWIENRNMNGFCNAMKACKKVIDNNSCEHLYLIRSVSIGHNKLKGYQIHQQIFNNASHRHLKPNLTDIHYLATYHRLVNAAKGDELLISDKPVSLKELECLISKSEILSQCSLLQDLGIVTKKELTPDLQKIKDFLLTKIEAQQLIGKQALVDIAIASCEGQINNQNIDNSLQELVRDNRIAIMNSQAKAEEQIVCLIPH